MILQIGEKRYFLNMDTAGEFLQTAYDTYSEGELPMLVKGKQKTFSLKKGGILRTILKQLVMPFLYPLLAALYETEGYDLSEPVRHEDLIDYSVKGFTTFMRIGYTDKIMVIRTRAIVQDGEVLEELLRPTLLRFRELPSPQELNQMLGHDEQPVALIP